ncbi:MAG TPA: glycosyltransferase family 4 protein [Ktedonobacteraceae bacterium]|nr:glycosyltransferase family 4 protein [Ktedonobacteraceae bacterium]
MRILWISDSPTIPTGFGNASRCVCTGLAKHGHHVSILGWWYTGQPTPWHNCMLYPCNIYTYTDELLNHLQQLRPDVLITQADVCCWAYLTHSPIADFMHTAGIPWALYYTIDGDMGENRLPPSWIRILKAADLPIGMSRYARDVAQANGVESACIPLGVDTKLFQPPADKQVAKRALGYEGKFVILSDARNHPRKMWPRTLEIFRRFADDKDDVILHIHCDPDTPEYSYDLRSDIAFLNLTEKVCLTKDMSLFVGLPIEQIVQLYQAADVHLLSSVGEGFGLPTLQAAATGMVPLAADYTANQELIGNHGEAISIRHFLLDQFGLRRALIDIDEAVSKLETLYRDRALLARKAQSGPEFALSYDWQRIVSQWDELLQREVPRRRTSLLSSAQASGIPSNSHGEECPSDLVREEPPLELKTSKLVADPFEDVQLERTLTIPVTLPLAKSKPRICGCVYVASQCDVLIVLMLHRIFPDLKIWSTVPLEFGSRVSHGKPLRAKVVRAHSPEYRPNLAVSTLALDIGSFDPLLPVEAAKLGVPCIGLAQQREQTWLWPELSLEKPDPLMAAELGRQMLTDQGIAADLCLAARQRLAGTLTPVNDRPLEPVTHLVETVY